MYCMNCGKTTNSKPFCSTECVMEYLKQALVDKPDLSIDDIVSFLNIDEATFTITKYGEVVLD